MSSLHGRRLELWLLILVLGLDQATKWLVREMLPLHESVTVIPGLLDFTHVRNTGAAFGILNNADFAYKSLLIAAVATAGLVGVAFYSASLQPQQVLARTGLALILGGAVGNLIDRAIEGSVVDFVDFYWGDYHFWAFNVADAAINVGVGIMILDMLGVGNDVSKAA